MGVLNSSDWIVIIACFGLIAGICVWVAKKRNKISESYFLFVG
jgi:general stress protein CsbA